MALEGSITLNELSLAEVSTDPSTGGGLDLPIGSLAILGDGVTARVWLKYGASATQWKRVLTQASDVDFTSGSLIFANSDAELIEDNTNLFWDNINKRIGIGTNNPQNILHIHNSAVGASNAAKARWTNGDTGATNTDGLEVGLNNDETVNIWNYENTTMIFGTNNLSRMRILGSGLIGMGTLTTPVSLLHLDSGDATASQLRFTAGTTTGQTATDGFTIGITSTGSAEIRQAEALTLSFFTSDTERVQINSTGNVRVFENLRLRSRTDDLTSTATSAGTLTLTVASNGVQVFTGTTAGQILRLPDATTLLVGHRFSVWNLSTQSVTVRDGTPTTISTILRSEKADLLLTDNSTAAGVWRIDRSSADTSNAFAIGFLQYSNGATATNSTTIMADISLNTDLNSFANGYFTKVSATEFRTDFAGRVRISYSVSITQAGTNRGARVQVVQNGTLIPNTIRGVMGSSSTSYSTGALTQIVNCANGDIFRLQFASTVGGQVSTIPIENASMLIEIYSVGLP